MRTAAPSLTVVLILVVASSAEAQPASDARQAAVLASPDPGLALAAPPPGQGDGHRLQWDPSWRRAGWPELTAGVTYGIGTLVVGRTVTPNSSNWRGGILFDGAMRHGLRLGSDGARDRIGAASDGMMLGMMMYPVLIDALFVALVGDRNPGVFAQMMAMNFHAFMLTSFLTTLTKRLTGRERPRGQICEENPDAPGCDGADRNSSFFSGHTAMAFTAAGLICGQHRNMNLYGSRAADATACGIALTAAAATGAFRMMADAHWFSDVFVGAAIGLLSGWLMPRLLNFHRPVRRRERRMEGNLAPFGSGRSFGLQYSQQF